MNNKDDNLEVQSYNFSMMIIFEGLGFMNYFQKRTIESS